MPIQKRVKWRIPPSDWVLRLLVRRPLSIGRVVELVDQLVTLEEISLNNEIFILFLLRVAFA